MSECYFMMMLPGYSLSIFYQQVTQHFIHKSMVLEKYLKEIDSAAMKETRDKLIVLQNYSLAIFYQQVTRHFFHKSMVLENYLRR